MNDLSELLNAIKSEINMVVERHLLPHFERMKCNNENIKMIETVLQQMPAFQRLERENAELKELLKPKESIAVEPTQQLQIAENIIKLEIVETPNTEVSQVLESELYRVVSLTDSMINIQVVNKDEEASEVETDEEEASEVEDEEETEASEVEEEEAEKEASEAEEEASEAEEEASEAEAEKAEEEEAEEEEEEEASEAEEEEEEEEAEEEEVEGAESLEEKEAEEETEEAEEDGVEGAEPLGVEGAESLEEEVSLIVIKGHGKFYTNNPLNGDIYKVDADEEVGDHIGNFVNGIPLFF